nr:MAG TPA: hypothetical protein [Caudoviricetes sp.]
MCYAMYADFVCCNKQQPRRRFPGGASFYLLPLKGLSVCSAVFQRIRL